MTRIIGFAGGAVINVDQGGTLPGPGVVIETSSGQIAIKGSAAILRLTFDWNDELPAGVTLSSVAYTVVDPITKANESVDTTLGQSTAEFSGGAHGNLYTISATATLSDSEVITRVWPLRVFNG